MLSSGMFGAVHFTEHPRPLSLQPPLLVDLLVFHVSIRYLTSHFQSGLTVHDSFPGNKGCCRYFLLFFFLPDGCNTTEGPPSVAPSAEMPLTMVYMYKRVCWVDCIHAYLTCCKQTVALFKIKHLDDHRIDEQALV